jgi:hypothetical protein
MSINLSIDKTGVYNFLPVGQKFYFRVTGLLVGAYYNLPQIGYIYQRNPGSFETIGRMPDDIFMSRVFKDSAPNPNDKLLAPIPVSNSTELTTGRLNQLICLKNVRFKSMEVGEQMAPKPPAGSNPTTTDRNIYFTNATTTTYLLRNSSAWRSATEMIPDSVGDIVCIYTTYNSTQQFYVRDINDLKGFKWDIAPKIFTESFANGLGEFAPKSVTGAQKWYYDSRYGAMISGYSGSNNANEDWLISPAIDIPVDYSSVIVSLDQALNYLRTQDIDEAIGLYISENYKDGMPNTAQDWTRISWITEPTGSNFTFVNSGEMDITNYKGKKVHFALKYVSTALNSSTWEVKNFYVAGKK